VMFRFPIRLRQWVGTFFDFTESFVGWNKFIMRPDKCGGNYPVHWGQGFGIKQFLNGSEFCLKMESH
jgi:hypothetical protein